MPPKQPTKRTPITHFICLPLNTPSSKPQLRTSLSAFTTHLQTLKFPSLPNETMPIKAIRPPTTLHLTLGILHLTDAGKLESALTILRSLDLKKIWEETNSNPNVNPNNPSTISEITDQNPDQELDRDKEEEGKSMIITLHGLQTMTPTTPLQTSILYTTPLDPLSRIRNFCLQVLHHFPPSISPSSKQQDQEFKLHATLLNTRYIPRPGKERRKQGKVVFDAREVLEDFEEMVWMRGVRVEKLAVCRMGAKVNGDGEEIYEVEGEVDMP